jgi:hypothetical protein
LHLDDELDRDYQEMFADQASGRSRNMSIIDYHVEDLVNRLRAYAEDDDEKILAFWEEIINVDIISMLAQIRQEELRKFQVAIIV